MAFFNSNTRTTTKITSDMLDATGFEGGNGLINLAYPSDLLDAQSQYGNAFTAFFISVHQEEQLAKTTNLMSEKHYLSNRKGSAMQEQGKTNPKAVGMAVMGSGAVTAFSAGKVANMLIPSGVSSAVGTANSTLATVTGTLATATTLGGNNMDYKQQKACIILPTPTLTSAYQFQWDSSDNKLVGGTIGAMSNYVNDITNSDSVWGGIKSAFGGLFTQAGNIGGTVAVNGATGNAVARYTGKAVNPRKEQLFREPNFRSFDFSYTFAPRSEEEARNVEAIIRQFKYHAHPSLSAGDFVYRYPSEFDIVHYHGDVENEHLPKHATSVLESVTVNYAPAGENFSFFSNGMPSIIQLNLRFIEIAVLTKEDIREGF